MAESSLFWDFVVHPEKYEGKTESAQFYDRMAKSITASVSPVVAKVLRDMPTDPSRKGSLIRGLTKNEIDRTAGVIRRGLEQGHHPREIARQLTLVKDLTPSMAQTLLRYEEALKDRKLSKKVIDKRMDTARKRMLIHRRQTIAMTEASYAQGIAREREARVKGYTHKLWITRGSYNVCPRCAANEGAGVLPIDTEFPSGVVRPPSHPRCRCVVTYTNEAGIPKATEFHKEITEATNKHREGTKAEVKAALEDWTPKTVKPVGLADVKPAPNYLETILRQKAAQLQKAKKGMSAEAKAKAAATRAAKKAAKEAERARQAEITRQELERLRLEAEQAALRELEAQAARRELFQPYTEKIDQKFIEDWSARMGITVDIDPLEPQQKAKVLAAIEDMASMFRLKLRAIKYKSGRQRYPAWYDPNDKTIFFTRTQKVAGEREFMEAMDTFRRSRGIYNHDADIREGITKAVAHAVHESGHAILSQWSRDGFDLRVKDRILPLFARYRATANPSTCFSTYAVQSVGEFIAESVAHVLVGLNNNPLAIECVRILKEEYGR